MINGDKISNYFLSTLLNDRILLFEFISGFIPILFCIIYFKFVKTYSIEIFYYSIAVLLLEIIGGLFSAFDKPNHLIYLGFYLLETLFFTYYYLRYIIKPKFRIFTILLSSIAIIALIINILNKTYLMNNVAGTIQSLVFIIISLICFYTILSDLKIVRLTSSSLFWINAGNFIYFSGRSFIFIYIFQVMDVKIDELAGYWYIVSFLLLIQRASLAVGISQFRNLNHNFIKK